MVLSALLHLLLHGAQPGIMFVCEVNELLGYALLEEELRIKALQLRDGFLKFIQFGSVALTCAREMFVFAPNSPLIFCTFLQRRGSNFM